MLDRSHRWTPVPNWTDAVLRGDRCSVVAIADRVQTLVSGDIRTGLEAMQIRERNWTDKDDSVPTVVGLGRMRALVVSATATAIATAGDDSTWHEAGFAVSDVSDGLVIFEGAGAGAFDLMRQLLPIDLRSTRTAEGGSARMRLDDVAVIAYAHRNEDRVRLHVESSHAAYVWQVFEVSTRHLAE